MPHAGGFCPPFPPHTRSKTPKNRIKRNARERERDSSMPSKGFTNFFLFHFKVKTRPFLLWFKSFFFKSILLWFLFFYFPSIFFYVGFSLFFVVIPVTSVMHKWNDWWRLNRFESDLIRNITLLISPVHQFISRYLWIIDAKFQQLTCGFWWFLLFDCIPLLTFAASFIYNWFIFTCWFMN